MSGYQLHHSSSQSPDEDGITAAAALHQLKNVLSNAPHWEKSAFAHAQRVGPELVNDEHVLKFLEMDDFDVELAATRLLKYWTYREKVFGTDLYALPLTLNGAMKEDIGAVKAGLFNLLPETDEEGRAIIYLDPSKALLFDEDQYTRVWWYLLHVAMEDPSVSKAGFVTLTNAKELSLRIFSTKLARGVIQSGKIFPIRWSMWHDCHMGAKLYPIFRRTIQAIMSPFQRETLCMHNGTDDEVVDELSNKHSFNRKCIPKDLGGSLQLSMDTFIKERLAKEGGNTRSEESETKGEKNTREGEDARMENKSEGEMKPKAVSDEAASTGDQSSSKHAAQIVENVNGEAPSEVSNINAMPQALDVANRKRQSEEASTVSVAAMPERKKKKRIVPGRKGDSRMNMALEFYRQNHHLGAARALFHGGFEYPDYEESNMRADQCVDEDGVSLQQRRNQLLRRVRVAKKRKEKK